MNRTKLGTASALLIALVATAVPTVAAEPPVDCVMNYAPLIGEGEGETVDSCVEKHQDECEYRFTNNQFAEWLLCLAIGE